MTQRVSVYSALYSDFRPYRIQQLSIQRNIQQTAAKVCPSADPRPAQRCLNTTATFLAKHELSSYTTAFDEHGWDSLPALQDISDDDLKQLVTDVAM